MAGPVLAALPTPELHDVKAIRSNLSVFVDEVLKKRSIPTDVGRTKIELPVGDGTIIGLHHFVKKDAQAGPQPAVVFCHGGGMIALDVESFNGVYYNQVSTTGVQIFAVDYRYAPEYPHPTPTEDCYAALTWLHKHAVEYNVDLKRVAIQGDSGGGGIAAGVALMARDRAMTPPLAKQILLYPMLDDRNVVADERVLPFASWNWVSNITGWTALLGEQIGKDTVSQYAAPARAKDLAGLPSTYIDVGNLDIFLDESVAYVAKLAAARVEVEFHLYPGLPHAFEHMSPDASFARQALDNRYRAIMNL